jgi:hypothetical protein
VKFVGVNVVDKTLELEYTTRLFGYISSLQKSIKIKTATAKAAAGIPK